MTNIKQHLPEDAIEVGRIIGPWGVKGSIRVAAYSNDAAALLSSKMWHLLPAKGKIGPKAKNTEKSLQQLSSLPNKSVAFDDNFVSKHLTIIGIKELGNGIRVEAAEIPDRNMAELLKGVRIFISRADFPKPATDEFYWIDLIGLQVINEAGEALGKVVDLMDNGPQSVLNIAYEPEEGQTEKAERLIPFVDIYIKKVDLEKGLIHVDWQLDY